MTTGTDTSADDLATAHQSLSRIFREYLAGGEYDPGVLALMSALLVTMDELRKVRDRLPATDDGEPGTVNATTPGCGNTEGRTHEN